MEKRKIYLLVCAFLIFMVMPLVSAGNESNPNAMNDAIIEYLQAHPRDIYAKYLFPPHFKDIEERVSKASYSPDNMLNSISRLFDSFLPDGIDKSKRSMERLRDIKIKFLKLMRDKKNGLIDHDRYVELSREYEKLAIKDFNTTARLAEFYSEDGTIESYDQITKALGYTLWDDALSFIIFNEYEDIKKDDSFTKEDKIRIERMNNQFLLHIHRLRLKEKKIIENWLSGNDDFEKLKRLKDKNLGLTE